MSLQGKKLQTKNSDRRGNEKDKKKIEKEKGHPGEESYWARPTWDWAKENVGVESPIRDFE